MNDENYLKDDVAIGDEKDLIDNPCDCSLFVSVTLFVTVVAVMNIIELTVNWSELDCGCSCYQCH